MRTPHFARLPVLVVLALGCTRAAEPAPETAARSGDTRRAASREEPIRLPFPGATGSDEAEYVFTSSLPSGGFVTYHRFRSTPEDPGHPIARVRVRSARFAGAGGMTPVYVMDDGAQHVFRRGPASDPYQANLVFSGSDDAEVDDVLARTDVTLTEPLGTNMPAAEEVCVGPVDALRRHRAEPSRAGVYDPALPIQGEHLNWITAQAGCVTYPALSGTVQCEGASLPWVATTLCQQ